MLFKSQSLSRPRMTSSFQQAAPYGLVFIPNEGIGWSVLNPLHYETLTSRNGTYIYCYIGIIDLAASIATASDSTTLTHKPGHYKPLVYRQLSLKGHPLATYSDSRF